MISRNNALDDQIIKEWKYPVFDGINNISVYKKSKYRILWIMKEPNKDRPREITNHRKFHKNICIYDNWRRTYQKIIYVTYGILNNILTYSKLPEIDEYARINGKYIIDDLAIININKNGGNSKANQKIINDQYLKHKEFLLTQIKSIDPNIIINASRVWTLFSDITSSEYRSLKSANFQYAISNNRIIVNSYHPNSHYKEELYCNQIFNVVKKWKE